MTNDDFKTYILPYYRSMYRVAASVMGSADEAADVVQDVMLRLWDIRDRLNYVDNVEAYCLRIVRNMCINKMLRCKRTVEIEDAQDLVSQEDIHSSVEWRDSAEFVTRAMEHLTPEQRYVVRLSAYGGFSNSEIAELMGASQGNVRVILSRARTRLKQLLSKNK